METTEKNVSWQETHFEVCAEIGRRLSTGCVSPVIDGLVSSQGRGALYSLAVNLTDEFEQRNAGREWNGEFYDEIDKFLEFELGEVDPPNIADAIKQAKNLLDMHEVPYLIGKDLADFKERSISWHIFDFTSYELDGYEISDESAYCALTEMIAKHDCCLGISWDTVEDYIRQYGMKVPVGTERWRTL